MTYDVFIRKIPLPSGVRAFTIPDAQGDYNIYINENLSGEQQLKSLEHEKNHILNDDFYKDESAAEIERFTLMRLNK